LIDGRPIFIDLGKEGILNKWVILHLVMALLRRPVHHDDISWW
jgi:hypothetical protein